MAFILDTLLLSPIKFTVWVAEKLRDAAYEEMTDDGKIQEELLHLQMALEMEEITESEYEEKEELLLQRLQEIKKLKGD